MRCRDMTTSRLPKKLMQCLDTLRCSNVSFSDANVHIYRNSVKWLRQTLGRDTGNVGNGWMEDVAFNRTVVDVTTYEIEIVWQIIIVHVLHINWMRAFLCGRMLIVQYQTSLWLSLPFCLFLHTASVLLHELENCHEWWSGTTTSHLLLYP